MANISNEKRFRVIPQQLVMSEASPFCQPWSYASDHPMEAMLAPRYFLSERDRLRPGDTLRIVQMEQPNVHSRSNKVLAFVDATVMSSSDDEITLAVTVAFNAPPVPVLKVDGAPVDIEPGGVRVLDGVHEETPAPDPFGEEGGQPQAAPGKGRKKK